MLFRSVQDLFLTETAVYADVILPASGWPEKDGTVTNSERTISRQRHCLVAAMNSGAVTSPSTAVSIGTATAGPITSERIGTRIIAAPNPTRPRTTPSSHGVAVRTS